MRILLVTDSFPPRCGGSGWSTWELARGLRAGGHDVLVVQARPGRRHGRRQYDGFDVEQFGGFVPNVPYVRNYFKNERLYASFAVRLEEIARERQVDIVHGQHVLSVPPAVAAAQRADIPAVATVRDYWPVCYWSTLIHDPDGETLCPECSTTGMRTCIQPRAGRAAALARPLIPYMQRNLARKTAALAAADAVIAVSGAIERDLRARAPALAGTRIERIPNPVDLAGLRRLAARQPPPVGGPYAVFVGKLEPNKGAGYLPEVLHAARLGMPLIVVGDGSLRSRIEDEAAARGLELRVVGWRPRDEVAAWLAHARLMVFPSRGPESLSRVLLEAAALGVPTAAMVTGGTADILRHGETGLLSTSPAGLAADAARLASDRAFARAVGEAARRHVEHDFDAPVVLRRIEALYAELVRVRGAAARA